MWKKWLLYMQQTQEVMPLFYMTDYNQVHVSSAYVAGSKPKLKLKQIIVRSINFDKLEVK